jgi:hypothetical protein
MRATQLTDFGTDQSPMMTVHSAKIRTKWKSATVCHTHVTVRAAPRAATLMPSAE